jgi:hypothetical protein
MKTYNVLLILTILNYHVVIVTPYKYFVLNVTMYQVFVDLFYYWINSLTDYRPG